MGLPEPLEITTHWLRSERSDHVFCYAYSGANPKHWVERALQNAPEGARLRFTVEAIDREEDG